MQEADISPSQPDEFRWPPNLLDVEPLEDLEPGTDLEHPPAPILLANSGGEARMLLGNRVFTYKPDVRGWYIAFGHGVKDPRITPLIGEDGKKLWSFEYEVFDESSGWNKVPPVEFERLGYADFDRSGSRAA